MRRKYVGLNNTNSIRGYRGIHNWVERHLGKPQYCIQCGTTEARTYNWSNISGEYKRDMTDWERLCRSCHTKKDKKWFRWQEEFCKHGHRLTLDNIYFYTRRRVLACKTCRRAYRLRFITKREEQS